MTRTLLTAALMAAALLTAWTVTVLHILHKATEPTT